MKILHYALGFPPYRSGGLTKFCMDLMIQQEKMGHQVALIWPGEMKVLNKAVSIVDRKLCKVEKSKKGIQSYEIINPLPIAYDEGIVDINAFIENIPEKVYLNFLKKVKPQVIHVHTLMGLHASFLSAAKKMKIQLVFTTHDFYPICPKVTMFRNGMVCANVGDCLECSDCNVTALSLKKIQILQSPLYRALKDSYVVKILRKRHRDEYLSASYEKLDVKKTDNSEQYKQLREYYYSLLKMMDVVHYNSSVSKMVYDRFFDLPNYVVINISHADVRNNKSKKEFGDHIRFTYLGAQSGAKGYFVLKEALDKLWGETHDFELNIYFNPIDKPPYVKHHERYNYEELEKIMHETDMLIAPSVWYETFGFTVLEALSYGVPVAISSNVGAKDILAEGTGVIVENVDSESLFLALCSVKKETLTDMNNCIIEKQDICTIENMTQDIIKKCYNKYGEMS